MPYLDPNYLNDAQFRNLYDEHYFQPVGVVELANASTPGAMVGAPNGYISQEHEEFLMTADSRRAGNFPFIEDQTVSVSMTPGFQIPDNLPNTSNQSFTAVDVVSGFTFYPDSYNNTSVNGEAERNQRTLKVLEAMAKVKESSILSIMEQQKTQLLNFTEIAPPIGSFSFDGVDDELQIDLAGQNAASMFFSINKLTESNDIGGRYRYVSTRMGTANKIYQDLSFGEGNSQNKRALGMVTEDDLFESNSIPFEAGQENFNMFAVRDGGICLFSNHPASFRRNASIAGGRYAFTVSDSNLPYLGSQANIFTTEGVTDATGLVSSGLIPTTASSNLQMTTYEQILFWDRFYIGFRPNSDLTTRVNDIIKIKGLT